MEEVSEEELAAFVGPRAPYYVGAWSDLTKDGSTFGRFNGAAFFLSGGWLLYRRLYGAAAIFLVIVLSESIASEVVFRHWGLESPPRSYDLMMTAIYAGVTGLLGNRWYYKHALRRIRALKASGVTSKPALAQLGGTSWVAPIVGVLAFLLAFILADTLIR